MALDLAAYALELHETPAARDAFVGGFALVPYDLTHGIQIPGGPPTFATLVTAQFLHGSALHLVANLAFLVALGPTVERLLGPMRFAAFYLACGTVGNLAHVSAQPFAHVPSIGASGAIAGVLGAFVVRFPLAHVYGVPAAPFIVAWIVAQALHGFAPIAPQALSERGGVAYFAHIGGFVTGVLAIGLFAPRRGAANGSGP